VLGHQVAGRFLDQPGAVLLGVGISWLLTLAFSVAPAWQNSRIVPADAMRVA